MGTDAKASHPYSTSIPYRVEDMRLSPHAFRVYVQLLRLATAPSGHPRDWHSVSKKALAAGCNMSVGAVIRAREELVTAGILSKEAGVTPQAAVAIVRSKAPQTISLPRYPKLICSWCKGKTICLEDHHYPVPRKDGGTETVSICANCHREYHFLIEPRYELTPLGMGDEE